MSVVGRPSWMKVQRPSVGGMETRTFAEGRLGGLVRQGGVCTLCKTHTDVASEQNRMGFGARWNDARPNIELSERGVAMQKLDAMPEGSRGEEGSRFAETSQRTRGCVSFAGVRSSVVVRLSGLRFSGNKCVCGADVQEG